MKLCSPIERYYVSPRETSVVGYDVIQSNYYFPSFFFFYTFLTSSTQNSKIINENSWCGRYILLPHHISVKHAKFKTKTGVAKAYPRHTTFQTGVATATPATPLPAPLPGDTLIQGLTPCGFEGIFVSVLQATIVDSNRMKGVGRQKAPMVRIMPMQCDVRWRGLFVCNVGKVFFMNVSHRTLKLWKRRKL